MLGAICKSVELPIKAFETQVYYTRAFKLSNPNDARHDSSLW